MRIQITQGVVVAGHGPLKPGAIVEIPSREANYLIATHRANEAALSDAREQTPAPTKDDTSEPKTRRRGRSRKSESEDDNTED